MVGVGDKDAAALAQELPGLSSFFDVSPLQGLEAVAGEEDEEEEELEWLSNKDAFPSVETMAVEAVAAPARVVGPRSKGIRRRRRVTAPWSLRPAVLPPVRRCAHCAAEETPQWRLGPDGPRTLCNACGVRFKTGRLLPEYRPANSPTFSPLLHSCSHRRVLEMRQSVGDGSSSAATTARARRAPKESGSTTENHDSDLGD